MALRAVPQTSIYEVTIENDPLEQALEDREKLKIKASDARRAFADKDESTKTAIDVELELGDDAPVRVGRSVLTRKTSASRSVSFETQPKTRIAIKKLKDE